MTVNVPAAAVVTDAATLRYASERSVFIPARHTRRVIAVSVVFIPRPYGRGH